MIDPVDSQSIFIAAFAGAAVVVFGALYSVLFAYARLGRRRVLIYWAYAAYGILVGAVIVLARVLHLDGFWTGIVAVMLAGYLLGPHAIWKLCIKTHQSSRHDDAHTYDRSES
jgi:hypothetical protein